MSEAEHLADWLDQAATAADLGRPKVKTDNRRLAAKALRKQQAEIDALRAKLALDAAFTAGKAIAAGAAPEPTKMVDRAWSRFCGYNGRGPDAPYPGMIEAFESHYGQNFTDKDWRNETGIWAAAWGYATRQAGAAPVPQGRKITATRIANHLKKSPLGDISMYRNGFFDGAKWAAAPKEPT